MTCWTGFFIGVGATLFLASAIVILIWQFAMPELPPTEEERAFRDRVLRG